jgi:hypothetical protein
MGKMPLRFPKAPTVLFGVTSLLFIGAPLQARTMPAPNKPTQNEDASAREIFEFNHFLEGHQDVATQLHSQPWLLDNYNYLQAHPELKTYIDAHPGLRAAVASNPVAFMQEDAQRSELAQLSRFLDSHREIAEQIHSNPTLAVNYQFLQNHPELRTYLDQHPTVRQALNNNPTTFVQEEEAFSRNFNANAGQPRPVGPPPGVNPGGPNRPEPNPDARRRQLADFNAFLDNHREIAEQVRRNPSLCNDRQFVQNHPALADFYRNNPGVRADLRQDANGFMREEDRINMAENRDRDAAHDRMADFGGFLDQHKQIARDIDRNPDAVKNREFVQNRPDLDSYLSAHPEVREDLMANPQNFVKGAQELSTPKTTTGTGVSGSGSGSATMGTTGTTDTTGKSTSAPTATATPKTKQ